VTVTYFTVDHNPELVKDLPSGFEWHLGYAGLETAVPLVLPGDVAVPPCRYKLGVVRGATDADWDLLLEPWDLWQAQRNLARAEQRSGDVEAARAALVAVKAALAEAGVPGRITAPTTSREMLPAQHLEMEIGLRGYATTRRFGTDPAAGVGFALRMDFGGLHRVIEVQEVFEPKKDD
jgi:hypothetical protein